MLGHESLESRRLFSAVLGSGSEITPAPLVMTSESATIIATAVNIRARVLYAQPGPHLGDFNIVKPLSPPQCGNPPLPIVHDADDLVVDEQGDESAGLSTSDGARANFVNVRVETTQLPTAVHAIGDSGPSVFSSDAISFPAGGADDF